MKPLAPLARETTPEGKDLVLYRRDGVYSLRLDGLELMSSRAHGSEEILAQLACEGLERTKAPRVLIAGLGFGYTLRATLARMPDRARVVVCEVFSSLLAWNRQFLSELAGKPLDDSRVEAIRADVWELLDGNRIFDAILMDVDNGPWAFTLESNERLYGDEGLGRIQSSLSPAGRLGVWSSDPAPQFERRLHRAGFAVKAVRVPARGRGRPGPHHTLFLAFSPEGGRRRAPGR